MASSEAIASLPAVEDQTVHYSLAAYVAAFPSNAKDREVWELLKGEIEMFVNNHKDFSISLWRQACASSRKTVFDGSLPMVFAKYRSLYWNEIELAESEAYLRKLNVIAASREEFQ
jgi:hypothetical protein